MKERPTELPVADYLQGVLWEENTFGFMHSKHVSCHTQDIFGYVCMWGKE